MLAHSVVAAVSDRRRRSEIDATIRARRERRYGQCAATYVVLYRILAPVISIFDPVKSLCLLAGRLAGSWPQPGTRKRFEATDQYGCTRIKWLSLSVSVRVNQRQVRRARARISSCRPQEPPINAARECRGTHEGGGGSIHRVIDSSGHLIREGPDARTPLLAHHSSIVACICPPPLSTVDYQLSTIDWISDSRLLTPAFERVGGAARGPGDRFIGPSIHRVI